MKPPTRMLCLFRKHGVCAGRRIRRNGNAHLFYHLCLYVPAHTRLCDQLRGHCHWYCKHHFLFFGSACKLSLCFALLTSFLLLLLSKVCTMVIKIVGQKLLRARNFSSFYRKKPAAANIANLFFECWYIGTGALVVVTRLVMFLLSSALWLGRIDVEFLDPNVKILGVRFCFCSMQVNRVAQGRRMTNIFSIICTAF